MSTEPEFSLSYGGMMSAPARLRIAIPSFRLVLRAPQPKPAPRRELSREELLALFKGELGHVNETRLTDAEQRDQELAGAFRRALYPDEPNRAA